MERITPWLGTDTAKHYQWYPFINIGHYELAKRFIEVSLKIQLPVTIKKASNSSGTKPNKMHSTGAFHLYGAAITSLLPLPFNVIGTGN